MEPELVFTQFERMCKKYPDRVAVIYLGEKFTYARLQNLIDRFATALNRLGIKKGDKVLLYISNSIQWVIAFFGIQKIGAVVVPVAPIYTSFEIEYMIKDSGAETIICLDTNFGYVQDVFSKTQLKRAIVTNLVDLLPFWKRAVGFLFDKIPTGIVKKSDKVYFFRELLKSSPEPLKVEIDPYTDLSYILYTGGTTGFPKGVPGNHMGMVSYVRDVMEDVAGKYIEEGRDTYIVINPLFHIMALGLFVAIGLNFGNTSVIMPVPQVDSILRAIEKYRVRWMLGVPALYRMILENDRLNQYDLSSLKYCYCGGDVLPIEVFKRWKEHLGVSIYQVYGSTEAGHVTYSRLDREPDLSSIGLPLKSRECKVVDPDTLEPVPVGEVGELVVTSDITGINPRRQNAPMWTSMEKSTIAWGIMFDWVRKEISITLNARQM